MASLYILMQLSSQKKRMEVFVFKETDLPLWRRANVRYQSALKSFYDGNFDAKFIFVFLSPRPCIESEMIVRETFLLT